MGGLRITICTPPDSELYLWVCIINSPFNHNIYTQSSESLLLAVFIVGGMLGSYHLNRPVNGRRHVTEEVRHETRASIVST